MDGQVRFLDLVGTIENTCKNCKPLTPTSCISGCKTWKLKNEFRKLHERTENPKFMTSLLNTLKNKRRLQVLEIMSTKHLSIVQLQQELQKLGSSHSQGTIVEEYVNPLIKVGLAGENQNLYHATLFGRKIDELLRNFRDIEDVLSPHSECYEEITLDLLMKAPMTYEKLSETIPAKSVPRVFSRLQKAELAETGIEKDHVFFFATKRSPNGTEFSSTEKRVYEGIPREGISARKLAGKTGISLRRTYKYVRKLKGKKLVFARFRPASYSITDKGIEIGRMLEAVHNMAAEALAATAHLVQEEQTGQHTSLNIELESKKKKDEPVLLLTVLQPLKQNGLSFEDTFPSDIK